MFSNTNVSFSKVVWKNQKSSAMMADMAEFIESYYDLETKKNADLDVVALGFEDCPPGHSYGPIMRPYHLVHFVTGGKGTLHIDDQIFHLEKGSIFYIPQDAIAYYVASLAEPWSYSWCSFLGRKADSFFYQFTTFTPEKYVIRDVATEPYAAIIRKGAVLTEVNSSNYFYANSVLLEVFSLMVKQIGKKFSGSAYPDHGGTHQVLY